MRDTVDTMRQTRRALWLAAIMSGCAAAFSAATLVIAVRALELIAAKATVTALAPAAIAIVLAVACVGIVDLCIDRALLRAGLWIDHVLEPRLLRAGLAETSPASALLDTNRALGELRDFIVSRNLRTLLVLPWLLVGATVLAVFEPRVGSLTLAVATIAIITAMLGVRLLRSSFNAQVVAARTVRRGVVNVAANSENLVGLGLATHACDIEAASNRTWIAAAFAHGRRVTVAGTVSRGVLTVGEIAIIAVIADMVLSARISGLDGLLLAALSLAALVPLFELPTHLLRLSAARVAWRRLQEVSLSEAAAKMFNDGPVKDQRDGAAPDQPLVLRDVDFTYPQASVATVSGISLTVSPGTAVILNGAPGSGKSTVAALLAGGLSPTGGLAMLGHHTVRQLQGNTRRPDIGWLMQEPVLMDGTVAQNITRFDGSELEAAVDTARGAGVFGVLATLRDGFATQVGADGRQVSMRQRRAIALARALHGRPSFVVLDEPETLLDEAAVAELAEALADLKAAGTGVVLVTRHPALAALATIEMLIVDGTLIESARRSSWLPPAANDAAAVAGPTAFGLQPSQPLAVGG